MKTTPSLLFFLYLCLNATAQILPADAFRYSLPKTQLCIKVEIEKLSQQPGMFYQYSERFLATKSVITEEKTSFRIKNIEIKTNSLPDTTRTFSYLPTKHTQHLYLTVNKNGILCGLNANISSDISTEDEKIYFIDDTKRKPVLLGLGEEYMLVGSTAKLAEGAAKQIYRIRENRISLLSGDLETPPSDGASMQTMLTGMQEMEQALTELFIGTTKTTLSTEWIYFSPDSVQDNTVLFRFSSLKGLTSVNDLSGRPIYISVTAEENKRKHSSIDKNTKVLLYTTIPNPAEIFIKDGITLLCTKKVLLPQLGELLPLTEKTLTKLVKKLHVDEQTGRLLRIE
jgi:hypothetical protein